MRCSVISRARGRQWHRRVPPVQGVRQDRHDDAARARAADASARWAAL